jgi:hypothetical protein
MPIFSLSSKAHQRSAVTVRLVLSVMLAASHASGQSVATQSVTTQSVATDPRAVQPERPTVATHAYTVAPGYVEIETGVQDMQPRSESQFVLPAVVKLGIVPRLQLELQGGYVRNTTQGPPSVIDAGGTDMAIALKQRVLDAAPVVGDFSVQGSIKFATGAHGVSTGTTDVSLLLISSRPIGVAELDLNAGYTRRSGNGTIAPVNATLLAASFGTPIHGPVGAVAELFSYPGTSGSSGTPPEVGFLTGPTLQVRPWLVLDAGVILNVQHMGANAAYAGLTYNVGRIPGFPTPRR